MIATASPASSPYRPATVRALPPRPARLARATGPNLRTGTAQKRHPQHRRASARAQPVHPAGRPSHALAECICRTTPKTASLWPPNRPRISDAPSSCSTSTQLKCSRDASKLNNANSLKRLHYPKNRRVKSRLTASGGACHARSAKSPWRVSTATASRPPASDRGCSRPDMPLRVLTGFANRKAYTTLGGVIQKRRGVP